MQELIGTFALGRQLFWEIAAFIAHARLIAARQGLPRRRLCDEVRFTAARWSALGGSASCKRSRTPVQPGLDRIHSQKPVRLGCAPTGFAPPCSGQPRGKMRNMMKKMNRMMMTVLVRELMMTLLTLKTARITDCQPRRRLAYADVSATAPPGSQITRQATELFSKMQAQPG